MSSVQAVEHHAGVIVTTRFFITDQTLEKIRAAFADTQISDEDLINTILNRGINTLLHPLGEIFSEN